MLPGDGECSISDILEGLRFTSEVDIVIPYVYNKINRSFTRRVISSIYTRIINFTFNTKLNYTNGTVLYKTSTIKKHKIKSTGFFFQTELLIRLIKSGYLYCEIPVFLQRRSSGVSKAISLKSLINLISCYIRTVIGVYITRSFIKPLDNKSATSIRIKKFVLKSQG